MDEVRTKYIGTLIDRKQMLKVKARQLHLKMISNKIFQIFIKLLDEMELAGLNASCFKYRICTGLQVKACFCIKVENVIYLDLQLSCTKF